MTETPAVSRSDVALDRLTMLIATCELAPGEWVTEKQLAVLTDLGLAPVRSAMGRLAHDGLLLAVPRVGYQVAPITLEDVVDLFDAWSVVGSAIVERAAMRASRPEIVALVSAERDLAKQVRAGKTTHVEMAASMFSMVVDMAHSKRFKALYERFLVDITRVLAVATESRGEMKQLVLDSDLLVKAIRTQDPAAALENFRMFVGINRQIVVDVLQSSPGIVDAPLRLPNRSA